MRKNILVFVGLALTLFVSGFANSDSFNCDWFCKYGNLERTSSKPDGCMIEKQRLLTLWTSKWSENIPGVGSDLASDYVVYHSVNRNRKIFNSGSGTKFQNGQKTEHLYINCVDALTGKHIFVTEIEKGKYPLSKSLSCPFVDDEFVYINTTFGRITKLDMQGNIVARFSVPVYTQYHSPTVYRNFLLIGSGDKNLYCLDKNTGETIWKYDLQGSVMSEIAISDDKIFIAPQNKSSVVCLDLDGKLIWKKDFATEKMATPVTLSDRILVNSDDGYLNCLSKENGNEIWRYKVGGYLMQFCATEDKIAIPTLSSVILLNSKTGEKIWEIKEHNIDNDLLQPLNNASRIEINYEDFIIRINKNNIYTNLKGKCRVIDCVSGKVKYAFNSIIYSWCGDKYIYKKANYADLVCLVDASDTVKFKLGEKEYKTDTRDFTMDVPPQVINGTTYIPAKYVVEPLGGQISWIDKTKTIKSTLLVPGSDQLMKNNPDNYVQQFNVLEMKVNSNQAYLNNRQLQIDPKNPKITPIIINGRTMVPLRFLAESLGCKVEWKADTKEIIVTYMP